MEKADLILIYLSRRFWLPGCQSNRRAYSSFHAWLHFDCDGKLLRKKIRIKFKEFLNANCGIMKHIGLTYFLLVSGGHRWVKHRGVWHQGRGSARTLVAGVLPLSNQNQSLIRNLLRYGYI